jgi:hypothetical protein
MRTRSWLFGHACARHEGGTPAGRHVTTSHPNFLTGSEVHWRGSIQAAADTSSLTLEHLNTLSVLTLADPDLKELPLKVALHYP